MIKVKSRFDPGRGQSASPASCRVYLIERPRADVALEADRRAVLQALGSSEKRKLSSEKLQDFTAISHVRLRAAIASLVDEGKLNRSRGRYEAWCLLPDQDGA